VASHLQPVAQVDYHGPVGNFRQSPIAIRVDPNERETLAKRVHEIIQFRARRSEFFTEDMFSDPAWDILLELSLAEHCQVRVTVPNLCVGTRCPQTPPIRLFKHLSDLGLVIRRDDPLDARRTYVELSPEASTRMRAFLRA